MSVLLDHLTAIFLGGAIMLLMGSVWALSARTSVTATQQYGQKARIDALRVVLDADAEAIGRDVLPADPGIRALTDAGGTLTFEFAGRISAPAAEAPDRIRYTAVSAACPDGRAGCRRLRRFRVTPTGPVPAGLDLIVRSVSIQAIPASPVASAQALIVRIALPATGQAHRTPEALDRRFRLINQELRLAS